MNKRSAVWGKDGALTDALRREVRSARQDRGFTQDRLAVWLQRAGIPWDRDTVAAFERGVRGVSPEELLELMGALRIGESQLFAGGIEMPSGSVHEGFPRDRDHTEDVEITGEWLARDEEEARSRVRRQAEERTASALGVSLSDLRRTARRMWGRDLVQERDLHVEERLNEDGHDERDVDPESLSRIRGHVTKRLRDELQAELSRKARRSRRKEASGGEH